MNVESLNDYYESLQCETDRNGLSVPLIMEIKEKYFHKILEMKNPESQEQAHDLFNIEDQSCWIAIESFWKPTGIVFGYPFSHSFLQKIGKLRKSIVNELNLMREEFWFLDSSQLHTTLISYSHYTERNSESDRINFPIDQIYQIREILCPYKPINIIYKGVLITNNGSLLLKGFVENNFVFEIRERLKKEFTAARAPNIVHIKLGQILTEIKAERIRKFQAKFNDFDMGKINFRFVHFWNGEKLHFTP